MMLRFFLGAFALFLATVPDGTFANGCIKSCAGLLDGNYQSCKGCKVYATCSHGLLFDNRPCPISLVWDDERKHCLGSSNTCTEGTTDKTCSLTCNEKCIVKKELCDKKCHCPDCSDEQGCPGGIFNEFCPKGYKVLKEGPLTVFCSDVKTCPDGSICQTFFHKWGVCCQSRPKPKKPKCCVDGTLDIDLTKRSPSFSNTLPDVKYVEGSSKGPCGHQVLLSADFQKINENPGTGCHDPMCGKRMLKVELILSNMTDLRSGHLFNAGDSISNNGAAGDGGHQSRDAEVHVIHPHINVWGNDICNLNKLLAHMNNAAGSQVRKITVYISNERVVIETDNGDRYDGCHSDRGCLWALNGQFDSEAGSTNERVYFGINRVVSGTPDRTGQGVCSVRMEWVCPCDDDEYLKFVKP